MMDTARQPVELLPGDHTMVASIFRRVANRHMHLDWRTFEQWLREPNIHARIIKVNDAVQAFVGATTHATNGVTSAWLRFMLPPQQAPNNVLDALWYALREDLLALGTREIACLVLQPWVSAIVKRWGFEQINSIVTLRRVGGPIPAVPNGNLHIRPGTMADIPAIHRVDSAAFEPLWAYSKSTLQLAQQDAVSFTVLEQQGDIVAYQLSTDHYSSGHLARLAVQPSLQGRGYGGMLVGAMLRHFEAERVKIITVNTQKDNIRSRRLYERLGFDDAGQDVPVYYLPLK